MAKRQYNDGEERKPAVTVKCKYCDWTGSARGLFTHVRLGHPGVSKKPESTQKHEYHPLAINKSAKEILNNKYKKPKELSTEEVIINICLKALTYYFERQKNTLEGANKPYFVSSKNS